MEERKQASAQHFVGTILAARSNRRAKRMLARYLLHVGWHTLCGKVTPRAPERHRWREDATRGKTTSVSGSVQDPLTSSPELDAPRSMWHDSCCMKILDVPRSGSYQGITSSRNRFGQYVRTRATPVNPASTAQGLVRARMSANAAAWRALTDAQREGWESLGAAMSRTDSLGQAYTLNGFMAYCSVNNNKALAGDASVSAAPALVTPSTILTATITLTAAAFSIAYTPTPMPAATRLVTYCSPQRSAGRNFEADFRYIAVSAAAAATPANVYAAYSAKFGVPVVGNRVFLSLHSYSGGFLSGPLLTSAIVA